MIESLHSPHVGRVKALIGSRGVKERSESGLFVAEGIQALREALTCQQGPAIETLSGVENGLGIISLEDVGINPLMAKVACSLIPESDAHFLVSPKSDWPDDWSFNSPPCPGLTLVEFNDDSELLIFAIDKRD